MHLFVPGRICLFGEHSDWAGGYRRVDAGIERGYTLICGTEQGIYAEVQPHPSALVLTATTPEGETRGPVELPMEPEVLLAHARRGEFWSYVAGVAYQVAVHYRVQGLVIHNYKTDLPIKKGLSSSAAICVLAARAFNRLYDLKLSVRGEMELAYQGEVTTPSRCGRMDQGCAFGRRPVLMTFDGDHLETAELQAGADLHFVVVDLQAQKDTMRILADLNRCYPCADGEVAWGVRQLLGPINEHIVHQAAEALQAGDTERLGRLMAEAQAFFDRYATPACPEELAAPMLHRLLSYEPIQPHVWGGKGVGSQGDGAAQFVARSQADQQAVVEILARHLGLSCLKLSLPAAPDAGLAARQVTAPSTIQLANRPAAVRKAVVPAAGLGTRLYPATKAVKKELFPVVDADGVAKPAILFIVEEALAAGIEEVILVVQAEDVALFRAFFAGRDTAALAPDLWPCARQIAEAGRHVTYAVQHRQDGFGHAVLCARGAVGDEPFLLMLGDHLYRSENQRPCARQLLDVYEAHGSSALGLRRTPERDVVHYGTVSGRWIEDGRLLEVSRIVEKPAADRARAELRVPGLPAGEYLTLFGLYILKPRLFDYLDGQVSRDRRQGKEIELTTALERLRQEDGFLGLEIEGRAYDIGLPAAYLQTLRAFGPKL